MVVRGILMVYEISYGDRSIGTVRLTKKGLYYEISCRDCLKLPHRIEMRCGGKQYDLGVCVPYDDGYGFIKHIPVKHIGDGSMEFAAKTSEFKERFIEVKQDRPFAYLSQLTNACFSRIGNVSGIRIKDPDTNR